MIGASPRHRSIRPAAVVAGLALVIPVAFIGIFFLLPVAALIARAVTVGTSADAGDSVTSMLGRTHAWHLLAVTLGQAGASTVIALVVALPVLWLYARLPRRGLMVLTVLVTVPFVLPTVVVGMAFRALLDGGVLGGLGVGEGWPAVLAAHAFLNAAVIVRVVGAAWRGLDTRPTEAAQTLGARRLRAFVTVVAPRLLPSLGGALALVFLFCSTSFGVIIILGGGRLQTLETEIYTQAISYFRIPEAVVLSMLQIVVVVAVLLCTRLFTASDAAGPATSSAPRIRGLRGRTRIVVVLAWMWTLVILLGPIVALALRSVRPTVGGAWTWAGYRALGEPVDGTTPLATLEYSMSSALAATIIALVVGVIAASALHRARGVLGSVANLIAMVPLGVSAVTLGFGYLIVLASTPPDVASSPLVIPCVQALIAVPVVIRIVVPALDAVPQRRRQAAASLGAPPLRVFATVDLPAIGRSVGAAAGFAFVMALGEFGATSFLARADTTTLPVLIGTALSRPGPEELATAMAASMLLVVATGVAVLVVELLRPRSGRLI